MSEKHIHFHLPADAGTIHITVTGNDIEVTSEEATSTGESSDAVEQMLRRFEGYDALTGARELTEAMLERGWQVFVPQPRGGTTSEAAYLRLVLVGARRKATLYMDSASLFAAGKGEMAVFAELGGVEVRPAQIRVDHSGDRGGSVNAALVAVSAAEHWAAGDE